MDGAKVFFLAFAAIFIGGIALAAIFSQQLDRNGASPMNVTIVSNRNMAGCGSAAYTCVYGSINGSNSVINVVFDRKQNYGYLPDEDMGKTFTMDCKPSLSGGWFCWR